MKTDTCPYTKHISQIHGGVVIATKVVSYLDEPCMAFVVRKGDKDYYCYAFADPEQNAAGFLDIKEFPKGA